ncbi:hypothetical protein L873DRAFT_781644 [Choiromyces venosus 120613-1]|uniref:Uncharacterized protein n=1 Tax=Choiromyces venosus 120613-1 TaxID=1336337 RepID=A0A3N4IT05_9PEZI|nr:hypothetical protein L873DRAFT_781644 [Choiromyces venosus 120613-1]
MYSQFCAWVDAVPSFISSKDNECLFSLTLLSSAYWFVLSTIWANTSLLKKRSKSSKGLGLPAIEVGRMGVVKCAGNGLS